MTTLIINQTNDEKFKLLSDPKNAPDSLMDCTGMVNVYEYPSEYQLEFLVPGMDNSDIEIQVDDNILTIVAETTNADSSNETTVICRQEFIINNFSRSFELPADAESEEIMADYKNGILILSIPKKEEYPEEIINITLG